MQTMVINGDTKLQEEQLQEVRNKNIKLQKDLGDRTIELKRQMAQQEEQLQELRNENKRLQKDLEDRTNELQWQMAQLQDQSSKLQQWVSRHGKTFYYCS